MRAGVVLALCGFALLGWQGVSTVGHAGAIDASEHLSYAEFLATHWRLPSPGDNYEYASPPLFQATAVVVEKLVRVVPAIAVELPWNVATRGIWLALVAVGAAAMTAARRRRRIAGAAALAVATVWGLDEAIMLSKSEEWTSGQLIALACGTGLVLVTGLIAREVWSGNGRRALAAAALVAAYPVVYRMSILFHPEAPFALLCGIAILCFLRAARLGWPDRLGWLLGIACAAAAVTRQPGALLIACLGTAALVTGGRAAWRFLLRAAAVIALVAGPWWIYAGYRWHNPLQSNLQLAPVNMLKNEPASFYVSVPLRSLVVHPYRSDFANALWPKLHADLWSDWFGALHGGWENPSTVDRVTASTQSVLGLFGDALALGGLAALALPAALRAFRRRGGSGGAARDGTDLGLGLLALVALVAFAVFVGTLIRFPQRDGDPIKSSYLLFTAPCWAVFAIAAWAEIRKRWRKVHLLLVAVAVLYVGSYGADLGSALSHPAGSVNVLGVTPGNIDLSTAIQKTSANPGIGGPVGFLVGVNNNGDKGATGVILTVELSPAMKLLGRPFSTQGTCAASAPIRCDFGVVAAQTGPYIRFQVDVDAGGPQTLTATATSDEIDANPGDNTSSYTVNLGLP